MELLWLICSIVSAGFTSLVLSFLLPFRALLRYLRSSRSVTAGEEPVSLYEGTVWHERRRPVHHSFRYAVRYALVDIDRAPNVLSDHLSGDEARRIAGTNGPVYGLSHFVLSFFVSRLLLISFMNRHLFHPIMMQAPVLDYKNLRKFGKIRF